MYKIGKDKNLLEEIPETSFEEIDMKERKHIQKCIISQPNVLGEELLIITEEMQGFEYTKERLDLLALDKKGNLVVIENKRDDSGTDVTWQAIKYASYCSTLTRKNIIELLKDFLEKNGEKDKATESEKIITDFLMDDTNNDSENIIYPSEKQRIILVSHNFSPEVLSAVQWLINNRLDISCVKLIPYKFKDDFILDSNIILPQSEIKEYTLKLVEKAEDLNIQKVQNDDRKKLYKKFWKSFDENTNKKFSSAYDGIDFTNRDTPYIFLSKKDSPKNCTYVFTVNKNEARVELYINNGTKEINKQTYKKYYSKKDEIEKEIKKKLRWEELPDKNASRISLCTEINFKDENSWEKDIFSFLRVELTTIENVAKKYE